MAAVYYTHAWTCCVELLDTAARSTRSQPCHSPALSPAMAPASLRQRPNMLRWTVKLSALRPLLHVATASALLCLTPGPSSARLTHRPLLPRPLQPLTDAGPLPVLSPAPGSLWSSLPWALSLPSSILRPVCLTFSLRSVLTLRCSWASLYSSNIFFTADDLLVSSVVCLSARIILPVCLRTGLSCRAGEDASCGL